MNRLPFAKVENYRLTRTFAIGGAAVIFLAGLALTLSYRSMAVDQLELMAQQNNLALTQVFANSVWPRFAHFVSTAHTLSTKKIVAHSETRKLNATLKSLMAGTRVLKVKLYDLGGLTVYSTDPTQIGDDYSQNARFVEAVRGGTARRLQFRETFDAFGTPLTDRWVLSSYIPIRGGDGDKIEGVAEIYSDVTDFYAHVDSVENLLIVIASASFGIVFVLLLAMVGWAERKQLNEYRRTVELTAATARAEAASKAKSEFLANMGHELRTPLNGIVGFAELIERESMGPIGTEIYKTYAAHIHAAGVHLSRIISAVLDLVQIESNAMMAECDHLDAVAVVREAVDMVRADAEAGQVSVSFETDIERLDIDSDAAKIRQIVGNLASNAIKFTPPGGTVIVSVQAPAGSDPLRILVTDSGVGMREEDIPLALAPFAQVDNSSTREFGGTGLGLPLASEMARLLGGQLAIASRPGGGTTITVALPVAAPMAGSAPAAIAA